MAYLNRKWIVSLQDDGMLKEMNGWYYICDSDGGIFLGYFENKTIAENIAEILNKEN